MSLTNKQMDEAVERSEADTQAAIARNLHFNKRHVAGMEKACDPDSSVMKFKSAVNAVLPKPKAVFVSPDFYRELAQEGLIVKKLGTPWGLDAPNYGIELPYYDGDIYLACDPALEIDNIDFKLPLHD